jgi:chemotaxis family two-component system response regulator Rcp1
VLTLKSLEMRAEAPSAAAEILLLSDKDQDIRLVKGAAMASHINVVGGCPHVLSFLRRERSFSDSPRPDLILLDLDLSNPEHCEMLREIKEDDAFRRIPVIVMAASDSDDIVQDAYDLHANAYVLKPKDPKEFVSVINTILTFWLTLARLPKD